MTTVRTQAPAKINLALHVTGQRGDGYHLIETLAVFADIGDRISVSAAASDCFAVTGPEAAALANEAPETNLVIRARELTRAIATGAGKEAPPVSLTLEKALPAGAGIGGGSADAAATLHALMAAWSCESLAATVTEQAVTLGADVPMCLLSRPLVARGIGEDVQAAGNVPALHMVLANPRRHVATPAVFSALAQKRNPPLALEDAAALRTPREWADWLAATTRNDLEAPSVELAPEIGACLDALRATPALMVRMSGSGATCFGVYASGAYASMAAATLLQQHPDWWIKACMTGPSPMERA